MTAALRNSKKLRTDIIKYFFYKNSLSLTELSILAGRSLPSVTIAVNSLIDEGYIEEKGLAPSSGGRRAVQYILNKKKEKYIVTVAIDQLVTRVNILDLGKKKLIQTQILDFDLVNNQDSVSQLAAFLADCIKNSNLSKNNFIGVGISMPGFVNKKEGINYSFFTCGMGESLGEYLHKELNLPIFLDNDSSLIALAELHFGAVQGYNDALVINIGWGTGLGIIINGALYRGSTGFAGEFSHIPLSSSNKLCSCGKVGCLEVETSLKVMVEKVESAINDGTETSMTKLFQDKTISHGDHFLNAVTQQDPLAISGLSETGLHLGKGIATLIHIMNPKCVVLSGRGARAGNMWLPSIQQAINEYCIGRISEQTEIIVSTLADDASFLAAASLVVENSEF